jgi:hypothetical protein
LRNGGNVKIQLMKRFLPAIKHSAKTFSIPVPGYFSFIISAFQFLYTRKNFRLAILSVSLVIFLNRAEAQNANADYVKTITDRSEKIVNTLDIKETDKYQRVVNALVQHYQFLNDLQDANKQSATAVQASAVSKDEKDGELKRLDEKKQIALSAQHENLLTQLKKDLNEDQIEKVKDGLTYRIMPITYAAYLDELPNLTKEQKDQIHTWLKEARELAIDAESSEKKHAVFGKYKGRINNYLSAAGYDMKKEGEEWQKRIKAREAEKKQAVAQ